MKSLTMRRVAEALVAVVITGCSVDPAPLATSTVTPVDLPTPVPGGPFGGELAIIQSTEARIVVENEVAGRRRLFSSTDGGETFRELGSADANRSFGFTTDALDHGGHLWLATFRGLYRSIDGGVTFEQVRDGFWSNLATIGSAMFGLRRDENNQPATLFVTRDNGETFAESGWPPGAVFTVGERIYLTFSQSILYSDDGGLTFDEAIVPEEFERSNLVDVVSYDGRLFTVNQPGVFVSDDGVRFRKLSDGQLQALSVFGDRLIGYSASPGQPGFRVLARGESGFRPLDAPVLPAGRIRSMAVSGGRLFIAHWVDGLWVAGPEGERGRGRRPRTFRFRRWRAVVARLVEPDTVAAGRAKQRGRGDDVASST